MGRRFFLSHLRPASTFFEHRLNSKTYDRSIKTDKEEMTYDDN